MVAKKEQKDEADSSAKDVQEQPTKTEDIILYFPEKNDGQGLTVRVSSQEEADKEIAKQSKADEKAEKEEDK